MCSNAAQQCVAGTALDNFVVGANGMRQRKLKAVNNSCSTCLTLAGTSDMEQCEAGGVKALYLCDLPGPRRCRRSEGRGELRDAP